MSDASILVRHGSPAAAFGFRITFTTRSPTGLSASQTSRALPGRGSCRSPVSSSRDARARLRESNAGALFDPADAPQEELRALELRLERRPLLGRKRDQQPAGRLRVVAEGDECV